MKPPKNLQNLKSFLGLVNYPNRSSPTLADSTSPLRALCDKETLFTWESSKQALFEAIKKDFTSAPVLALFDQSKAGTIQSDASEKGLLAVLLQDEKPVIYASRILTETKQRYSNIERELLSVVFTLKRFHNCVYRSQYDVNIEYLKEKDNVIADALSRVPPQSTPKEIEDKEDSHALRGNPRRIYANWRFYDRNCRRHYFRLTDAGGGKWMAWIKERLLLAFF